MTPSCYDSLDSKEEEYGAQTQGFITNPPDTRYEFLSRLAKGNKSARSRMPARADKNIPEMAAVFAHARGLKFADERIRTRGIEASFVPVLPLDNRHFIIAGTRRMKPEERGYKKDTVVAVVFRVDDKGDPVWSTVLPPKGTQGAPASQKRLASSGRRMEDARFYR
ncbi:MAG: hypothetical protein GY811_07230 [Myxococcales bacterium]|nr:hypothetical protein [Myxococcales bacterium]